MNEVRREAARIGVAGGRCPALLGLLLAAGACGSDEFVEPRDDGDLTVIVVLADDAASQDVDHRRITIEGPTRRTFSVSPATTETTTDLPPGSYTVALEGVTGGDVEQFGERSGITIVAGSKASVSVTVRSFVPVLGALPSTVQAGQELLVQFDPVVGATSYTVEWDYDPAFPDPRIEPSTANTTVTIRPAATGRLHVRVRATNRLGSRGRTSARRYVLCRSRHR